MTVETKTTIELGDIKAVEFECADCGSKAVLPIAKLATPPMRCSFCQKDTQWLAPGGRDYSDIVTLGRLIGWFSSGEKPKAFSLRLHVTNACASREGHGP